MKAALAADKKPLDIGVAMQRIAAVAPWPKAALFQLSEEGYTSAFEQLIACIISCASSEG